MKLLMFWHAAGVINYHDRFESLVKYFDCFSIVIPKDFKESKHIPNSPKYNTIVLKTKWNYHPSTLIYNKLKKVHWKNFDMVWIHEEAYSISAFQIATHCIKNKIPYILESAVISMRFSFFGLNWIEKIVMNNSACVCYRNQQVKSFLLARGLDSTKVGIEIANGVAIDPLSKIIDNKNFEIKKNSYRIGFVGRVFTAKGVLVLAKALSLLQKNIEFVIAGQEEKNGIIEEIISIYPNTKYLGKLDFKDLNTVYQSIDILVLPSIPTKNWTEQFGRVLSECIAKGTYSCGSNIGAIPRIVGKQNTFMPNNIESLKSFLENILENNSYRVEWMKQYENISKNMTWDSQSILIQDLCISFTNKNK